MSKTDVLLSWLNETWGNRNFGFADKLLTENATVRGAMTREPVSVDEVKEFAQTISSLLGPLKASADLVVEQDDWLAARIIVDTENPRDRTPFRFSDHFFVRFEGGKIAEVISQVDYFTLFENLGQLPQEALAACMTGEILDWKQSGLDTDL
ncbi:ester cyclase [Leisingera aquaemixtae]|uniref:ester cyclase n=1 Tax=Leisingera aquaemixtae TaxID=1396826 RepID=UPI001C93C38B|nr:ester cyclase [Leisingera aquaemixtae]MBY6065427.1 ester cyclase [Leisingera aquaemixtae]